MPPPSSYAVDCGTVTTTGHADGTGGTVELAVAVVYSNGDHVPNEPVVFLDGGPGAGSISALLDDSIPFTSILEEHDLVLFDQRGTGFSTPRPDCTFQSADVATVSLDPPDGGLMGGTLPGDPLATVAQCRKTAGTTIDLSIFRSAENGADAEAVRVALGYTGIHLYGISYGTRYALTVLRDHPAAVQSAIIDSVVPLQIDLVGEQGANVYRAIHLIGATCAKQPSCAATYGDVEAKELAVLQTIAMKPPLVTLPDGTSTTVPVTDVANLLVRFMYSTETISLLPELVQELTDGDYSALRALMSGKGRVSPLIDNATYLSVTCADEFPFSSPGAMNQKLASVPEPWRRWVAPSALYDLCRVWNVPPSPPTENDAVISGVPSLVVSGAFDPVTPPSYGVLAAQTLSHSTTVVFPAQAHASSVSECGARAVQAFLTDPANPPTTSCASTPMLAFQSLGASIEHPAIAFDTSRARPSDALIHSVLRRFPYPSLP